MERVVGAVLGRDDPQSGLRVERRHDAASAGSPIEFRHGTILAIAISTRSVAPASISAGITRLIFCFSSTDATAYPPPASGDRVGDFIDDIEERVGDAEALMATQDHTQFRQMISTLRHQIASVRRFLAPQRDALDRLNRQPGEWLMEVDLRDLRDEADRITRYLEDLDLARERTWVLREEFLGQLAQEQNSRMYVLSVVAAIFLPLTFVTGLLGMNVGGLPGLESPRGFAGSVVIMVVAAIGLVLFFRSKKWL